MFCWITTIKGFTVSSVAPEGMEILHDVSYLLNRGGMISMANTVMICYTGFALTAILIRCGILDKAVEPLMHFANTRVKAVFTAELAIFVVHAVAGISYLSSVFVGAAWKKCYVKNKIGLPALSRTSVQRFPACSPGARAARSMWRPSVFPSMVQTATSST